VTSHAHPVPNFGRLFWTPPTIPDAVVVPENPDAQRAFPEASEVRINHPDAQVGSRNQRKFPVPATSRVYHGFTVLIQIRDPVWKMIELFNPTPPFQNTEIYPLPHPMIADARVFPEKTDDQLARPVASDTRTRFNAGFHHPIEI
jgi:hypothetical protein